MQPQLLAIVLIVVLNFLVGTASKGEAAEQACAEAEVRQTGTIMRDEPNPPCFHGSDDRDTDYNTARCKRVCVSIPANATVESTHYNLVNDRLNGGWFAFHEPEVKFTSTNQVVCVMGRNWSHDTPRRMRLCVNFRR